MREPIDFFLVLNEYEWINLYCSIKILIISKKFPYHCRSIAQRCFRYNKNLTLFKVICVIIGIFIRLGSFPFLIFSFSNHLLQKTNLNIIYLIHYVFCLLSDFLEFQVMLYNWHLEWRVIVNIWTSIAIYFGTRQPHRVIYRIIDRPYSEWNWSTDFIYVS